MTQVTKNGVKMSVKDENQLAAFLNSGWEVLKASPAPKEAKAEEKVIEKAPEIVKSQTVENDSEITRESIQKMPFFSLKSLAEKNGIRIADKSAKVIKAELIEALGL